MKANEVKTRSFHRIVGALPGALVPEPQIDQNRASISKDLYPFTVPSLVARLCLLCTPLTGLIYNFSVQEYSLVVAMAIYQRLAISILLILTAVFMFFASSTEAAKGPKITHKVQLREGMRMKLR